MSTDKILEDIYQALLNDNKDIDAHIDRLKESGQKEITVDPLRLMQNNRQGRKMMQSYFKKRGVTVSFKE